MLYTVEIDGALFKTVVEGGNYHKLGHKDFTGTRFFGSTSKGLFTLNANGDLFVVSDAL